MVWVVGHKPKCTAGAELHVGDLHPPEQLPQSADLVHSSRTEKPCPERISTAQMPAKISLLAAPRADEGGQLTVAAVVALGLDLLEDSLGGSAVLFCPKRSGFESCSSVSWKGLS